MHRQTDCLRERQWQAWRHVSVHRTDSLTKTPSLPRTNALSFLCSPTTIMTPWLGLGDVGRRLKSLFTTRLSRSTFLRWRKRDHRRANNRDADNVQGLKPNLDTTLSAPGTLSPQPPTQFVLNNPPTVFQSPLPPTAPEFASSTPTPTPTPIYIPTGGGDPLTHGRSNPPLFAVHTETGVTHAHAHGVPGADTRTNTHLNPIPIPTPDVPIATGSGSAVDSGCPTERPPRTRALLVRASGPRCGNGLRLTGVYVNRSGFTTRRNLALTVVGGTSSQHRGKM